MAEEATDESLLKLQKLQTSDENFTKIWDEYYNERLMIWEKMDIDSLLEKFQILAEPDGYRLLLQDFHRDQKLAAKTGGLINHWPSCSAKIVSFARKNFMRDPAVERIFQLNDGRIHYSFFDIIKFTKLRLFADQLNSDVITGFLLLPLIFDQKKIRGKKLSREEAGMHFFQYIEVSIQQKFSFRSCTYDGP